MLTFLKDFVPTDGVYHPDQWKLDCISVDLKKVTEITINSNYLYFEKDNGAIIKVELDLNMINPKFSIEFIRTVVENINNLLRAGE